MSKNFAKLAATFAAVGLTTVTGYADTAPQQNPFEKVKIVNVEKVKLSPEEQAVTDEFITASNKGELEKVKALLPKIKDIDAHFSKQPVTALDVAILGGQAEVLKFLLDNGADYTHDKSVMVIMAAMSGSVDTLDVLVQKGANLVDIAKTHNVALLPQSIVNNRSKDMASYLIKNGFDDEASKNNALMASAMVASKEIATMLIDDHGVQVTQELVLAVEEMSKQAELKGVKEAQKVYKDMAEFLATKYLEQQKKAEPASPAAPKWAPGLVPRF